MSQSTFIKGIGIIIGLIIICIIVVYHSYTIWHRSNMLTDKESFQTTSLSVGDVTPINDSKTKLNDILRLMAQQYPNSNPDLSVYGLTDPVSNANSPLKLNSDNLDSEYQIKFIQELQNQEITNLESTIGGLKNKMATINKRDNAGKGGQSAEFTSIKHIPTGKLFGILKNPNQVGPQISVIIDPKNATCLKYVTPDKTQSTPDTQIKNIDLTACDYNPVAPGQKFIIETVTNNNDFNSMISTTQKDKYAVSPDYGFGVYPFSVLKASVPNTSYAVDMHMPIEPAECITLDNSGLSIEPCTGKESQRFTVTNIPFTLDLN